jgi:hypothetical protein
MNIMISYRRADSGSITGRIYDRLRAHFGPDHVFIDIDSIPMGTDYRRHIHSSIGHCDVLLPVIGPQWTGSGKIGQRRIDDPGDLVRLEVAHALERNIRVIPLLVDNARLPGTDELPDDLKSLRFRNALRVDSGIDFHHHIDRLCTAIETAAREAAATDTATSGPAEAVTVPPPPPPPPAQTEPPPPPPPAPAAAEITPAPTIIFPPPPPPYHPPAKPKWPLAALALVTVALAALAIVHFLPSKPNSAGGGPSKERKVTRVPDGRHFPAGSVGAQLVGIWKQGETTIYFFEDSTFATEDPAKGGDEGRWELSGRHVIARGNPSHPTRTWILTLSSDGKLLNGRMSEKFDNSPERTEPMTLRRQ